MKKIKALEEIILTNSPLAWWEFDVINNTVDMNDLKVTMLGYDPADFRGKGYEAVMQLVHPDDTEKTMEAMRDILSGKKNIYQIDYRIRDNLGMYHWYMDRGVVIAHQNGRIWKIRGIVFDLGIETSAGARTDAIVELLKRYADDQDRLIVVCSSCHRVRLDNDVWTPVTETLLSLIKDAKSHGICRDCSRKLYPEFFKEG